VGTWHLNWLDSNSLVVHHLHENYFCILLLFLDEEEFILRG
jgi:hypothetical protein